MKFDKGEDNYKVFQIFNQYKYGSQTILKSSTYLYELFYFLNYNFL